MAVLCRDRRKTYMSGSAIYIRGPSDMRVRDVIRIIEEDGWYLVATKGSHRQYKHPTKPGRVTIAGNPSHDLAPGTLGSVLKQAGLKRRD
jgi:predicted RNA binding protein YcfA (HicA-like mRNA interferase family)